MPLNGFEDPTMVKRFLSVLPTVHHLEVLDDESWRFEFQDEGPRGRLPVNMLLIGFFPAPALTVWAMVNSDCIAPAIAATRNFPMVGLGAIDDQLYLKLALFKSSATGNDLNNAITIVGWAHNFFQQAVAGLVEV